MFRNAWKVPPSLWVMNESKGIKHQFRIFFFMSAWFWSPCWLLQLIHRCLKLWTVYITYGRTLDTSLIQWRLDSCNVLMSSKQMWCYAVWSVNNLHWSCMMLAVLSILVWYHVRKQNYTLLKIICLKLGKIEGFTESTFICHFWFQIA